MLKIEAPERAARGAALTVAAGAVACGVCCVLPFALPAVALASSGGIIAWLAGFQFWATVLAANIVARRMDLDRGAKRKCESQACAINDLHDGNFDRSVALRAAVVPRRAIDYPSYEAMTVIALWASHFIVHTG